MAKKRLQSFTLPKRFNNDNYRNDFKALLVGAFFIPSSDPMKTSVDLQQLVECVGDAIIVADAQEKIVLWNPAATRIFGYSEAEALGHTLDLIVPERQRQRHSEGYTKSMETGTTRYGTSLLKVPAKHKNGSTLSIAFTVGMLFDVNQKANGVVAIIRDETERFAEERALKRRLADLENPQL